MSDTLQPHGLQHTRFPCPSPSPRICSNTCPLSQWCHPNICRPLLLLPSIFPSIGVFYSESAFRIRWPKYSSFSFSISPSNEYSGWISFKIDWFDLFAVKGILKSLLQHHSSKASVLRCSAFFMVQLSHPYMATGKTVSLTRSTFVGKVMFLLFNMLSNLVIAFLPRSKCLLISWLQSPSALILEPPQIKSVTVSVVSPSICHEVMGPDAMILVFWMLSFKPVFSFSSFTFIKRLFSSSSLSAIRYQLHIWDYGYFSQQSSFWLALHLARHFRQCTLHISWIGRVTIYSLNVYFQTWNQSVLCPVLFLLDLHKGFSRGRSGGLVFPSFYEFSTACHDPHSQRL